MSRRRRPHSAPSTRKPRTFRTTYAAALSSGESDSEDELHGAGRFPAVVEDVGEASDTEQSSLSPPPIAGNNVSSNILGLSPIKAKPSLSRGGGGGEAAAPGAAAAAAAPPPSSSAQQGEVVLSSVPKKLKSKSKRPRSAGSLKRGVSLTIKVGDKGNDAILKASMSGARVGLMTPHQRVSTIVGACFRFRL